MGVDHSRFYVLVTEKLLRRAHIITVLRQMHSEGMAKDVITGLSSRAVLAGARRFTEGVRKFRSLGSPGRMAKVWSDVI